MKPFALLSIFVCFAISFSHFNSNAHASIPDTTIQAIDQIIAKGEKASVSDFEPIKTQIEKDPDTILPILLSEANKPDIPDWDLSVYIWAIGVTKSPKAIDDIIKLSSSKDSERLHSNTHIALAKIGGEKVGKYLLGALEKTTDPTKRYTLLDLLAQIQYTPALPKTLEILKQDPKTKYWQNIFVFGKYGDLATPFLLKHINSEDENIRANTMMVLGQWLIPVEASDPLKNQYWTESNPKLRGVILSSLEKVTTDLEEIKSFSEKAMTKESDELVASFAKETITNSMKMGEYVAVFKAQKKHDKDAFSREYQIIKDTFGTKGDYTKLSSLSVKQDEDKLKQLKEIVLQRNSDECFDDYQKINNIIMLNRLM